MGLPRFTAYLHRRERRSVPAAHDRVDLLTRRSPVQARVGVSDNQRVGADITMTLDAAGLSFQARHERITIDPRNLIPLLRLGTEAAQAQNDASANLDNPTPDTGSLS